ncbi:MAG TPA: flavodoxin family protein [Coriobacteriia bacterium]
MNAGPLLPGTVLGIAGSPRRDGNSERLLDACLEGAREAGAAVRKLSVVEAGIAPCRGCNACSSTGQCVVRDGMQEVYPLLDSAAAVVVATPVFFATVPATLKALYDRCQPYWARRYVLRESAPAPRPAGILVVRGGGDPFGYECAVTTTRSTFAVLGLKAGEPLVVDGVDSPSDIGRHADALEAAAKSGAELAAGI